MSAKTICINNFARIQCLATTTALGINAKIRMKQRQYKSKVRLSVVGIDDFFISKLNYENILSKPNTN